MFSQANHFLFGSLSRFCDGIPSRKTFLLRALSILISLRGRRKKGRGRGLGEKRERGEERRERLQ